MQIMSGSVIVHIYWITAKNNNPFTAKDHLSTYNSCGASSTPVSSTFYFAETHANSYVSTLIPNHAFYVFHAQSNIWLLLSSFFSLSLLFSVQIFAQGHFLQSIVSCNFLSHEITHLFVCSVFSCTLHTFSEGLSLWYLYEMFPIKMKYFCTK